MSIGRAQAQAIADGFLDTLGVADSGVRVGVTESILAEAAKAFITSATARLDQEGNVDTGELATALVFDVTRFGQRYEMSVGYPADSKAAKYFDFVNKGVRGVRSSSKAPTSPYQYRNLGVPKSMATALLGWLRRQGGGARNVNTTDPSRVEYGIYGKLEAKRVRVRDTIAANGLRSTLYGMGVAIKAYGLKTTSYFDGAVQDTINPELTEALAVALAADIRIQIRRTA